MAEPLTDEQLKEIEGRCSVGYTGIRPLATMQSLIDSLKVARAEAEEWHEKAERLAHSEAAIAESHQHWFDEAATLRRERDALREALEQVLKWVYPNTSAWRIARAALSSLTNSEPHPERLISLNSPYQFQPSADPAVVADAGTSAEDAE